MALSALASYGDSDSEGSDEKEEVKVRRKTEIDTKAILGVKRTKDNRGTVQISLPQFKSSDSSDEDDECRTKPKKKPPAKSGTGLTSLLPQPKRSQVVKKNTPLIPYTLKKSKPSSAVTDEAEDDSNVQFFSNLDSSKPALPSNEKVTTSSLPSLYPPSLTSVGPPQATHTTTITPVNYHDPQPQTYNYDNLQPSVAYTDPYGYHHGNSVAHGDPQPEQYSSSFQAPPTVGNPSKEDDHLKVDEASLHRLAGGSSKRGRRRGMEEESLMNIKDISETEIKDAVAYQKYLTEGHSHTSGTVPEDLAFSSTQKRKHQIHWLAAQAKAKEQELKSFWSQAAATRKQTQMKYGF